MAVTKIKPIRGTVNKAIAYILDPQKTDDAFYVSSYGCAASDAAAKEFEWTRNLAVQQGMQMPKVLARHLIQSFDIGEVGRSSRGRETACGRMAQGQVRVCDCYPHRQGALP